MTGGSEVVEITFATDSEQPPAIETSEDNNAIEYGTKSIAVWTGIVGLITMKEANNTSGDMTTEIGTTEHGGDVSPKEGIDSNVSDKASETPHVHKDLIQGDQHADIEKIKHRTGWGQMMDYEMDQLEWEREQGNVTRNMNSFDSKTNNRDISETPMQTQTY